MCANFGFGALDLSAAIRRVKNAAAGRMRARRRDDRAVRHYCSPHGRPPPHPCRPDHRRARLDGNGRRDLIRSVPDVLASTANYLKGYGWERGQPWTEGTHNFSVLKAWNKAEVYQKTIALFATRLAQPH